MAFNADQLEPILAAAVEIDNVEQRSSFIRHACAGNADMERRVEELVANHFRAGQFLEPLRPGYPVEWERGSGGAVVERPGTTIGAYRLLEKIGEGGFGVVFVAEQERPLKRRVALKIIKPGMDTRQVVARFEVERQTLALMDHPGIARILDGGETESGRPYFVMELVRGDPITEFCDAGHLSVRERLELFVRVCEAVQHAHQRGTIHRDLKPSNILVEPHDEVPVVKIIDFGIAKATGQQFADITLRTNIAQMVGTPMYMSPEQAQLSGLDIDTRSDIYSLGVLLYELLTGTTPFTKERFRSATFDEIRQIIREEEPPKPSSRLTLQQETRPAEPSAADTLEMISANRHSDPRRLSRLICGELDWIVMKALEKDRNRRYESANDFAMDVRRYLADEPVLAFPPAAVYRLRKFAWRYKKTLVVVAAFGLLLMTATAVSIGLASWAIRERNQADEQKRYAEGQEQHAIAQQQSAEESFKKALQAVDQMLTRVSEDRLMNVPHMEPVRRELLQDALGFYQGFLRERGENSAVRREAANAYKRVGQIELMLGHFDEGEAAYCQAAELLDELLRAAPGDAALRSELVAVHNALGIHYHAVQRLPQSEASFERGMALLDQPGSAAPLSLENCESLAAICNNLILVYRQAGEFDKAESAFLTCQHLVDRLFTNDPQDRQARNLRARSHNHVALVYAAQQKTAEAEAAYLKALEEFQELIRDDPKEVQLRLYLARAHNNLALLYTRTGADEKAEWQYQRSFEMFEAIHNDHPKVVEYQLSLAGACANMSAHIRRKRSAEESLEWADRSIALFESMMQADPRFLPVRVGLFDALMGRAYSFVRLERHEEAAADWRRMIEISEGQEHINIRLYRPLTLVFLDNHAAAAAEVETLLVQGHTQGRNRLIFAKVISRCSASAARDPQLSPTEREQLADQYGGRAVAILRQAQAAGYFQDADRVAQLKDNADWEPIQMRPDFTSLLAELEAGVIQQP